MKTQILRTSIFALAAAAASYAQSSLPVIANIPFSFVAGRATLPAGEYKVDQSKPGMIIIKSADRKANAVLLTGAVRRANVPSASTLLFHRYGDVYFLSQVWIEGERSGRQALVTAREQLKAKRSTPDETIVAAVR